MPLRYCENPGCCRIFCSHWGDVEEVVLRPDVVAVQSTSRSSEVRVFLTTMRSWDLASCMYVEGGVQAGPVEVLEEQGLPGTRPLPATGIPHGFTVRNTRATPAKRARNM